MSASIGAGRQGWKTNNTFIKCNAKIMEIIYTLYHSSLMKYSAYYIRRYYIWSHTQRLMRPPGVLGSWEGYFFRELGSTGNYFREAGEQAHTFGDLRSSAKN